MLAIPPFWLHLAAIASLLPVGAASLKGRTGAPLFWVLALAAAVSMLGWLYIRMGHGWALDFAASLDVIITVTLVAFLVLSAVSRTVAGLAPLVLLYCLPLGVLSLLFGSVGWGKVEHVPPNDWWFWLHIVIAVTSFALATLAAIAGVAVWIREWMLKNRRQSAFVSGLPAMLEAEAVQFRLLQGCAVFLAAVVATGMATSYETHGTVLPVDHKSLLTLVAFFLVLFLLIAHRWLGWRGRRAVQIVLAVELLLALGYPGVKFITDVLAG
jgi:ABC-type uncharacterized transport system permease subunit